MTTLQIAEKINIPHDKIMKFYWDLENKITTNRKLIKCTLVIDHTEKKSKRHLSNLCESLILLIYVEFNKTHLFDNIYEFGSELTLKH